MKKRRYKKKSKIVPIAMLFLCGALALKISMPSHRNVSKNDLGIEIHEYSETDQDEKAEPLAKDVPAGAPVSEAVMPEGSVFSKIPVSAITIDGKGGSYPGSGSVYIKNDTDYKIDIPTLLNQKTNIKYSAAEPAVLIVHTHGSEAYTPDSTNYYTPTDTDRTTDKNYNVIRVGNTIENILNANGIKTIHSTILNDSPSYNGSYTRTLEAIAQSMKEHPSIKFVIDVHRDAMISQTGKKYKTVADINGRQCAQLMFVAGTDAGGLTHANWRENLGLVVKLQDKLNTTYPGLMRPINIRAARFNQHVTTGSMLLEVGTSGNSLDEALYSAELFAQVLADNLKPLQK